MKKAILAVLCILLVVSMLSLPLVVSASTAVEKAFDPVTTQWYSVDYVRTSAADAVDDAYVYTWTPAADGNFTLEADTACKDTLVTLTNKTDSTDKGITLKYYPKGGFSSAEGVDCKVKGGSKYEVTIMTCSETSGTVSFFAYYESASSTGLKGAGTLSDPYILDGSIKNLPSTKKGETVYYLLSADKTKKFDLTVKGKDSKDSFDLYVENISSTVKSSNGAAKAEFVTPFTASGYIFFSIKNNNNGAGGGYSYSIHEVVLSDTKGTFDDPATLVLDTETTANITDVCYYYTYTAAEDATLAIEVLSDDNWVCSVSGGEADSLYITASDNPVVNPMEYDVKAGEEITVWFATESFGRGAVSFKAYIPKEIVTTAVVTEATEVVVSKATDPAETTPLESKPADTNPVITTEPTEAVSSQAVEPTSADANITETSEATLPSDEPVDSAPATNPVETTSTEASSAPVNTTEAVSSDETYEELYDGYCLSTTPVDLGENKVFTSKDYDVTLYEFYPSETGFYKISADDANALVGAYVGSINYIFSTATGTENEVTVEFSAGNEIIIGVKGVSSCNLKIEKVGEIEVKEETPWTVYENTADISKFEASLNAQSLASVFTYDKVANDAVLGDDGYYHLDSAAGEILYVDLNSKLMSLVGVVDRGKLCAVFYDEEGNVTEKIDYTPAVFEYIENSMQVVNGDDVLYLYPLTADLIEMYSVVGATSGWYGRTGWVGGLVEDAWMFACMYEKGNTGGLVIPLPPSNPSNPSAVPTGRNFAPLYIATALILLSSAAFVITRKKVK